MNRVLFASLVVFLAFTGVVVASRSGGWSSFQTSGTGLLASADEQAIEAKSLTVINALRQQMRSSNLAVDPALNVWLRQQAGDNAIIDARSLLSSAQKHFPCYLKASTLTAYGLTVESLMQKLEAWQSARDPAMTHVSIAFHRGMFGLGWQAYLVAGQRLPDFTPEAMADNQRATFYSRCGLCGHGSSCEIPRHSRSLSLACSHCKRTYAALAADTQGRFRYMNEFLTGYEPPAHFRPNLTRVAELMTIWQAVARQCRYIADTGTDDNDAWQTALETQTLGKGDCEDSAILLADWLIARGFQARVALGRYAERGGHAWVVVRLDKEDYLLESTEGASYARALPTLVTMGARYVPEMLFDRDAFYTRLDANERWHGDYWNERKWERVVPRAREKEVTTAAVVTDQ